MLKNIKRRNCKKKYLIKELLYMIDGLQWILYQIIKYSNKQRWTTFSDFSGPIAQKRFKRPNGVLGKCLKKHFFTNRKTLKCQFI